MVSHETSAAPRLVGDATSNSGSCAKPASTPSASASTPPPASSPRATATLVPLNPSVVSSQSATRVAVRTRSAPPIRITDTPAAVSADETALDTAPVPPSTTTWVIPNALSVGRTTGDRLAGLVSSSGRCAPAAAAEPASASANPVPVASRAVRVPATWPTGPAATAGDLGRRVVPVASGDPHDLDDARTWAGSAPIAAATAAETAPVPRRRRRWIPRGRSAWSRSPTGAPPGR